MQQDSTESFDSSFIEDIIKASVEAADRRIRSQIGAAIDGISCAAALQDAMEIISDLNTDETAVEYTTAAFAVQKLCKEAIQSRFRIVHMALSAPCELFCDQRASSSTIRVDDSCRRCEQHLRPEQHDRPE